MESPTAAATIVARHTCLKLEIPTASDPQQAEPIFVKGTWFHLHFTLSITDGRDAWLCEAAEDDVRERASQWDQPAAEYIELAERYLGFQQPGSIYAFSDAGNGYRRLSWTLEKEGTKLEWWWRCKPSPNSKKTTADILDFFMDANIRLSEEVVRKTQAFDRLKEEAEKCLALSERLSAEKDDFESEVYAKFVSVLNSKKAKLRELRDRLSKQQSTGKLPEEEEEEEESSDRTEPFISGSDDGNSSEKKPEVLAGTSKRNPVRKPRGRKRGARI
ncbi:DNA repair protein xrcc4 [Ancistrocladus abbreviatus]